MYLAQAGGVYFTCFLYSWQCCIDAASLGLCEARDVVIQMILGSGAYRVLFPPGP